MIKLTEEQIKRLEDMLNDHSYVLDYYKKALIDEDFKEIHDGKEPDIIDSLGCVFVASGRYRKNQRETYFSIENSSKYGIDYSIKCKNCYDMSKETFEEVKNTTLEVLKNLEENYVEK